MVLGLRVAPASRSIRSELSFALVESTGPDKKDTFINDETRRY